MSGGLLLLLAAGAAVIGWILGAPLLAARRRARLRLGGLDESSRAWLHERWPLYRRLPAPLRRRLDRLTAVFLGEKEFVGCGGLAPTPEMKLWIGAQACLLVLGRDEHVYDALRAVLVYPGQFVVDEQWHDEHGIVTEEQRVLAGQAWDQGRILLSWEDVEAGGGAEPYNVVIHEFAHYLDHEAGGALWIAGAEGHARWAAALEEGYQALCDAVDRGEQTLLDPYATEDLAEFFAVASETFFEAPEAFRARHPGLYRELAGYYRLDPAAW